MTTLLRLLSPLNTNPPLLSSQLQISNIWALGPKLFLAQSGKLKLTADDPGLRRSARRKNINKGYKDPSCSEKDCVACSVKPPTISANVIKNLGATFCKIDPNKLSDEALLKKKKASAPGGKKLKKPQDKNDDASKPDKKKSRK